MRDFLRALAFLTRIPVPARVFAGPASPARTLPWYPLVGGVVGGVLVAAGWALQDAPPMLAAVLLLLAWVALTGALHLDGLADSADAWIGGLGDRERTLSIMKDPRCGPAGVVALVLVLLVKFAALSSLPAPGGWLLLPPLLARGVVPLAFLALPYVRPGGLGSGLAEAPRTACGLVVVASAGAGLACGAAGLAAVLAVAALYAAWHRQCHRRLGGFTGDTAGALVELAEAAALVALVLVLAR